MSYAYTMRGVGSMAMIICTVCTVSKIDIMATSVPLFSLVNATGISNCSRDIVEESCVVHQADVGGRDAIAILRLLASGLSFLGAASIIVSAMYKRRVLSPKVHPIFVFSIADIMLSMLWIAGSALWLLRHSSMRRGWCFAASLMTVILECVAINLTFVYALLSYSAVKKLMATAEQNSYEDGPQVSRVGEYPCSVWHPLKSTVVYIIAWLLPVVVIMVPFAIITTTGHFPILNHVYECTCWCRPAFGNVVPYVGGLHLETSMYIFELRKIMTMYGAVLTGHYIVVFISLMIVYYKLLRFIVHVKKLQAETNQGNKLYETMKLKLRYFQSQTKKRVASFIIIFVVTGIFNFILSALVMGYEAQQVVIERHTFHLRPIAKNPYSILVLFYLQSLTLPLQGFFNAIVYGWTQGDFVEVIGDANSPDERTALIQNPIENTINYQDTKNAVEGLDTTLATSRSVTLKNYLTTSIGELTDNHDETEVSEEETSLSLTVTIHRV